MASAPPPPRPPPPAVKVAENGATPSPLTSPPPPVKKPPPPGPGPAPPSDGKSADQMAMDQAAQELANLSKLSMPSSAAPLSSTDKQHLADLLDFDEKSGARGKPRVAVIGAGPAGQAFLRACKLAQQKGVSIPDIVCFEKQGTGGGMWNYTWRRGLDEFGEPVHSGMYRYLWSNAPKEALEFPEYTFSDHFGQDLPSYPPRAIVAHYIRGRYEKANIRDWIRLHTVVRRVCMVNGRYRVTHHDLPNDVQHTEDFDYVVVATGHFSVPVLPEFPGFDQFPGPILHSHDFRDANEFRDKAVLIIGRSFSAEDIASQCVKYGARWVTVSYRTRPMGWPGCRLKLPSNMDERPLLEYVEDRTCYFKDKSSKMYDAIILCTGYQHNFPFLDGPLRLPETTQNKFYPAKLYRGVVCEDNPTLFFMGMQNLLFSLPLFEAQAFYIRDLILGTTKLPSLEDMRAHTNAWRDNEAKIASFRQLCEFQGEYVKEVMALTELPPLNFPAFYEILMAWNNHKEENFMGFRDHGHRSVFTGRVSPVHVHKWVSAMDDDPGLFLRETRPYDGPVPTFPALAPSSSSAPPPPKPAAPLPPVPAVSPKVAPPPSPHSSVSVGRGPPPPPR